MTGFGDLNLKNATDFVNFDITEQFKFHAQLS